MEVALLSLCRLLKPVSLQLVFIFVKNIVFSVDFSLSVSLSALYGDAVDDTDDETLASFSLIRLCLLPSAASCKQ